VKLRRLFDVDWLLEKLLVAALDRVIRKRYR
jgi:hypothetical protein